MLLVLAIHCLPVKWGFGIVHLIRSIAIVWCESSLSITPYEKYGKLLVILIHGVLMFVLTVCIVLSVLSY